jgi:flagellar hook-associated protein 3 FlgL
MRVTSSTFPQNLIVNLQGLAGQMANLQEQTATGQRITRPEDDPVAVARVMDLRESKSLLAQYEKNANRAANINNTAIAGVRNQIDLSDRAGEIAVLGKDLLGQDAANAYAAELNQMIEQAVQNANTKYAGEAIFGGTVGADDPFVPTRDSQGRIIAITNTGMLEGATFQISEGTELSPFPTGEENDEFAIFIDRLITLRNAFETGSDAAVRTAGRHLGRSEDDLLIMLSGLGAIQMRIEVESARNSTMYSDLDTEISRQVDVDLAESLVELGRVETAYQAALQSSARIMNLSLFDYL